MATAISVIVSSARSPTMLAPRMTTFSPSDNLDYPEAIVFIDGAIDFADVERIDLQVPRLKLV